MAVRKVTDYWTLASGQGLGEAMTKMDLSKARKHDAIIQGMHYLQIHWSQNPGLIRLMVLL